MATKHTRNAGEQKFWDEVFQLAYPDCLKTLSERGVQYCAHLAREAADAALEERRSSQKADRS
jgi:hypothetical protein